MKRNDILIISGIFLALVGARVVFTKNIPFFSLSTLYYIILIIFVLYWANRGIKYLRNMKRGEPAKDELSKKIEQKAKASSFEAFVYILLAIHLANDIFNYEIKFTDVINSSMIIIMILYTIFRALYSKIGLRDE